MQAKLFFAVALAGFATLSQAAPAQQADGSQRNLTRAEVRADLALWRQAGLDTRAQVDGFDTNNPDYLKRVATYQRWRNGPEFVAAVQQQQQRGVMATQAPSATVQR